MDIATALTNGTMEIDADGNQIVRPPTALATRAASHIKNLENQHQAHLQALMQLQQREAALLQEVEVYSQTIKEQDAELQNLRKNREPASAVGSTD